MKIGFFSDNFLPMWNSGVVISIIRFGTELVKRGHEVHIYCPTADRKEYNGMKIHSCSAIPFKPYPGLRVGWPINMNPPKFDLVHCHSPFTLGWYGIKTGLKQEIPKIMTYHTIFEESVSCVVNFGQEHIKKISTEYMNFHHSFYDYIISPSKCIDDLILGLGIKHSIIPTGIDFSQIKIVENAKEKLGLSGKKVYLSLSRVAAEKNIDVLIKAANKFLDKDSVLLVVGAGPALPDLKKIAHNKNIVFTGFVPGELLSTYYSAADFFMTASKSETQGLTTLEAMAHGTPVIAANAMANPEYVFEGKTGFLFSPDDVSQLAELIKKHPIPSGKMKKSALETAKKYTIEKCTDNLLKVYHKLI